MPGQDSEGVGCPFLTRLRNSPSDLNVLGFLDPWFSMSTILQGRISPVFKELGANDGRHNELTMSKKDIYIVIGIL